MHASGRKSAESASAVCRALGGHFDATTSRRTAESESGTVTRRGHSISGERGLSPTGVRLYGLSCGDYIPPPFSFSRGGDAGQQQRVVTVGLAVPAWEAEEYGLHGNAELAGYKVAQLRLVTHRGGGLRRPESGRQSLYYFVVLWERCLECRLVRGRAEPPGVI